MGPALSEAFNSATEDSNRLAEITFHGRCLSLYACVCLRAHSLPKNDDRITTHSEPCSGKKEGPRQRMRERCNIFIRQEQAPLAKNEFVRLLDRGSLHRFNSGRAGSKQPQSKSKKKKK